MPANERIFTINGVECCVAVRGRVDDPAVLLVGSSMLSWPEELCDRLVAGGRRVIRYDVRDTGRSESYPPGEPGYSFADLVDDAVGVLDATATERAHVAGLSTGGWIAQLLALSHPARVATTDVRCATTNIAFADHGPRWREQLGDIAAPTLVLHGEDDPFFPIGNGLALAAEIPGARLVRLAGVGHRLPAQAVPVVAEELIAHTAG